MGASRPQRGATSAIGAFGVRCGRPATRVFRAFIGAHPNHSFRRLSAPPTAHLTRGLRPNLASTGVFNFRGART